MGQHTPRQFFDEFVKPAHDDWREQPQSKVRAINAIAQVDNLAEHMAHHLKGGTATRHEIAQYRRKLRARAPSLGIAWDAHDSHKHGPLGSHSDVRLMTQGQGPALAGHGGPLGSLPIAAAPIGGSIIEMSLQLDDGSVYALEDILRQALVAWETELKNAGL